MESEQPPSRESVIACRLDAIPSERAAHVSLAALLFRQLKPDRQELSDGYEFRFAGSRIEEVARFIANERHCCPFVTFELISSAGSDHILLRMTGPPGTREILRAALVSDS